MTEPVRAPQKVLEAISAASKRCPSLRIGQLLCVAMSTGHGPDLFYIEDDALVRLLSNVTDELPRRR